MAPLFSLAAADDVTGMARGIAFQLVEALGVLERQKVAEEVKGLDQPARATLRKYGVRFGAYHIYLPILLKPAPRSLATQLWALKHESPDAKGVSDLLHLAASGRTSIPIDKETPKLLYRTAGYRVCGERAVRVDILERLADLIRPALSWRETSPGPKPDGVFDGRGFTVTGAMTSLTGASSEDFASILRSLGYRMDRKPKPAEPAAQAATPASEAAPSSDAPTETPATETAASDAVAPAAEPEPVACGRRAAGRVATDRGRGERAGRTANRRLPMFCRRPAKIGKKKTLFRRVQPPVLTTSRRRTAKLRPLRPPRRAGHDRGLASGRPLREASASPAPAAARGQGGRANRCCACRNRSNGGRCAGRFGSGRCACRRR